MPSPHWSSGCSKGGLKDKQLQEGEVPCLKKQDGTIQTGIYQKELEKAGLTAVTPPEDIQKTVMSIIYDEIKRGETGSREKFAGIDAFLREAGCDCAILGCTELSVYRVLHSLPPYYIDAMEVLAEEAILRCGKQLRNI